MRGCDGVRHMLRFSGLLRVEGSLVRISRSGFKTGGVATAGGAHDSIAEVASESS
jgi:hypothetical protein